MILPGRLPPGPPPSRGGSDGSFDRGAGIVAGSVVRLRVSSARATASRKARSTSRPSSTVTLTRRSAFSTKPEFDSAVTRRAVAKSTRRGKKTKGGLCRNTCINIRKNVSAINFNAKAFGQPVRIIDRDQGKCPRVPGKVFPICHRRGKVLTLNSHAQTSRPPCQPRIS